MKQVPWNEAETTPQIIQLNNPQCLEFKSKKAFTNCFFAPDFFGPRIA
jgi:hypothetical protein